MTTPTSDDVLERITAWARGEDASRATQSVAADVGVSYPDDLDRDVCERLEELRRGDVESG